MESAPLVLATGGRVAFRRGDAFHAIDLESGLDSTLADLRTTKDPDAPPTPAVPSDAAGFLAGQQLRLFEVLAERKARKEELVAETRARRTADPTRAPPPFYLGEKRAILRADLSPSGGTCWSSSARSDRQTEGRFAEPKTAARATRCRSSSPNPATSM